MTVTVFKGKTVVWYTDSNNCVSIIEKGSTNVVVHNFATKIFTSCAENGISLNVTWIDRSLNTKAGDLSRLMDNDDYGITDQFFSCINSLYGPHDVDRFANSHNHKLSRYNSLFWTPDTEAVDAFSVNWFGSNNWLVPPVFLLPKVLNYLTACKPRGTLVAPYWPSSPFFDRMLFSKIIFMSYLFLIAQMRYMFKEEILILFLEQIVLPAKSWL